MAESSIHIRLVEELSSWISNAFLDGKEGYMLVDHPNSTLYERPPKIGHYIPDVYVPNAPGGNLIIGEAKTSKDLDRNHSLAQIREFLRFCSHSNKSYFVLAVPWYMVGLAKAIIREFEDSTYIDRATVIILEKLPG